MAARRRDDYKDSLGEERGRVRSEAAAVAPRRCPRCHDPVDPERDAWVACCGCLSRLHTACWEAGGGVCASCGETRTLSAGAPSTATGEGPELALDLTPPARRPRELDVAFPLLVGDGVDQPLRLRLRNTTPEAQTVTLRLLPPWLELHRATPLELAPGEEGTLELCVRADAAPARKHWSRLDPRSEGPTDLAPAGTFLISTSDDARTVGLCLWSGITSRHAAGLGVLAGLWAFPFGIMFLFLALRALLTRPDATGQPAEVAAFLERVGRADRRAATRTLAGLAVGLSILLLPLLVLGLGAGP